ncbi:sulfite exporter TauE/SafE family protein [Pseudomonas sp. CFBP 8770]|uniref:sulfite exporter TauE/SafE family protein n=1 Tax=unclassified Pseudomonas TaxID=196821 RepID=UPI00177FD297|nr:MULTISPECIES: sulfite exporter TauE/SafE family protein [unclassified Pseudomonas]MBD8473001.1 sulfite exporter TauE/SafE family protein [Pseudomonas sp. CFBP 8773]MBD8645896.1 sulfite exporter TauE/SafE family protein [Pseudomonas sp. CFBP 8770]
MLTFLLGACVGLVLGLTGAGGGILAIPALTLGLGWSVTQATPVALLAVGSAALIGAIQGLRQGLVRYKAAATMAAAGWVVAPVGIYVAARVPGTALMAVFAVVMLIVACRMYLQARRDDEARGALQRNCMLDPATGRLDWNARCLATLASIGATSGFLTGLLGVGGGFFIVPAFRTFSDVRMHGVVATSLMVVTLVSLGTLAHLFNQGVTLTWAGALFTVSALVGMIAGRLAAPNIPAPLLQQGFSLLCVGVSLMMLGRAFCGVG